jgi:carboxyl-terminal processing protease
MFRSAMKGAGGRSRRGLLGLALAGVLTSTLFASFASARPTDPDRKEQIKQKNISIFVSSLIDKRHMAQLRVNDEIAKRALEMYFKTLDPMKLYFYQSDVDQFAPESTKIDDAVKAGDVTLAKKIFDLFLTRVAERTAVAQALVDQPHDFTVDETMERDPEKLAWFKTKEEADERWRKRVKYDLLLQSTDDETPADKTLERLHKRYQSIARRWDQTSNDELLEMFLTSVTMSFDPHSSYMSPENLENFAIQMRLELDGIGASLES